MKSIYTIIILLSSVLISAQRRPNEFPVETNLTDAFEIYSQLNGIPKKSTLGAFKDYITSDIVTGDGSVGPQGPQGEPGQDGIPGIGIAQDLQLLPSTEGTVRIGISGGGLSASFSINDSDPSDENELQELVIDALGNWALSLDGGSGDLSEYINYIDDHLILFGDTIDLSVYTDSDSIYQYAIADGSTSIEVWATGSGVTINENPTGGELTIYVPLHVDLHRVNVKLTASAVDNDNNYYVKFDYTGERSYNTIFRNLNLPNVLVSSAETAAMSRNSPVLYSPSGNAGVDVGISAYGGGDGSDLEIAIKDFLLASNQFITFKF